MRIRIGQGYDVHRLVAGRALMLGGEEIPHPLGLDGHSDADVLLHALGDALLGAAGLGDLGQHFPPSDERWRGASSMDLLARIVGLVLGKGWRVLSCDMTLIAEAPRLAPYRDRIRARVAAALGLEVEAVGLKATTNEGLGAIGRGEGRAAMAVVLLGDGPEVQPASEPRRRPPQGRR
jgi:2-C-methyl-D-erythritol 2,4-cyclodiphosphate synthase